MLQQPDVLILHEQDHVCRMLVSFLTHKGYKAVQDRRLSDTITRFSKGMVPLVFVGSADAHPTPDDTSVAEFTRMLHQRGIAKTVLLATSAFPEDTADKIIVVRPGLHQEVVNAVEELLGV